MGGARKRLEMNAKFWSVNLKESYRSRDVGVDGNIILEWIVGKVESCGLDSSGSG
jgi:hypothetical protein